MKKKPLVASIAITIFAVPLLYQGIYNLNNSLQFFTQCLNGKKAGALSSYYSCQFQFNDIQLILIPLALFGIALWLGYWGIRGDLSKVLYFRPFISMLGAAVVSALTLILNGVAAFSNYLDCIKHCPRGTCGGMTGTDPIYNCAFPYLEFVLPLVIIGTVTVIIATYFRKKLMQKFSFSN